ncbi:hypothetical protein [uncultured Sphingomonas sp.]|uniref:hypothetical protein n=1 Tax=uncultured Sphingomonas sp. TaxID=158754 RepID=UPI0030DAA9A0
MIWALALALAGERVALGVWHRWAAIREAGSVGGAGPRRCFAIAQPVLPGGDSDRRGAFGSVAARQGAARAPAVFFRLSHARGAGAAITLVVGERRFALVGDQATARAPDAATDRAILNAIRSARAMTLVTLDAAGRTIADTYPLAGAATAIDAAQLGCR